jgi:excisionase family DNA binding protein
MRNGNHKRQDSGNKTKSREFYTVHQLADLLQVTEAAIYRMVEGGELPCHSTGRVQASRDRDISEAPTRSLVSVGKGIRPSTPGR